MGIELEKTVQREVEERMALLADKGVSGLGENTAFASSTLKLLSLSPAKSPVKQNASGDDKIEKQSQSIHSQPIAYVPSSLADLTKKTRGPLPSLSQGRSPTKSTISNISASSRNTNTKT